MDPLAPLISNLLSDGRPRVWSLVITVFGDCVQHRGGRVATVRLNRLLGRIGIESGALRTALSRLSRDGWVEGRKSGRTSSYALTSSGLAEFGPATARIYAAPRHNSVDCWSFSTNPRAGALRVAGGWLARGPEPVSGFQITGSLGPDCAGEVWQGLEHGHKSQLEKVAQDVQSLGDAELPPLDACAARILLVHRWRRLVLRYPDLPPELVPNHFPIRNLHQAVADCYTHLTPAAEQWLDHAEGEMHAMPSPNPEIATRFGLAQKA